MAGGYVGKLLRVDLGSGKIADEPLPSEEILRKFIGGWGLGLKILYDELPLGIAPWDARNPLIFMTGPLTGTGTVMSNNATLITLNFETEFTAGRSHSHGFWGPNLKFAGYDGIIIEGASDKPVFLWIHEGNAELLDAGTLWGKDTHETENLVKEAVGEAGASVAAIGPAGENICSGALIENDENHSFAHAGVGAVMGSKKLKAIAVFGKERPNVANPDTFKDVRQRWLEVVRFGQFSFYSTGAIARSDYTMLDMNECGVVTRNWQSTELPGYGVGMSRQKLTGKPCFACPIACGYDVEIIEGPYKGYIASLCGGGEAIEALSSNLGISEVGACFYLPDIADRLGLEGSYVGTAMSLAFECYQKGILTKEDTDGLELEWGDAEVVETLMRKIAAKEGFGKVLAEGSGRAAEIIGGEAPQFAIHSKNAAINLHDWKSGPWGPLFGQFVGGGTGWQAYANMNVKRTHVGREQDMASETFVKYWTDSIGHCWMSMYDEPTFPLSVEAMAAATGWDLTEEEARQAGERILNLERIFNLRRGLKPEDDYIVPKRTIEAPVDGRSKGLSMEPHIKGMVMEYYRLLGWDQKTGKPRRDTMEKLGLEDIIPDVWEK